jgi:ElaB/YqjD/DUF883 family membrane-anchored ribosome-binding protein
LTPAPDSDNTAAIKSEIERTRIEMSETIGEIQDRLRPDHLLQQAKDGVTEAAAGKVRNIMKSAGDTAHMVADQARGIGSHLSWYAREHPVRMALTVGAVTWWILRGRETPRVNWQGAMDTSWEDPAYPPQSTLGEKVGEYATSARDTVGEYATSARETVGEYAESARSSARRASERVRTAAANTSAQAGRRLRQAGSATTDWVEENPVAAGAIALAVGIAIGLTVPRTDIEDRTMGEARDTAWEKARGVARNLGENVTQKVETAVSDAVASATPPPTAPDPNLGRV